MSEILLQRKDFAKLINSLKNNNLYDFIDELVKDNNSALLIEVLKVSVDDYVWTSAALSSQDNSKMLRKIFKNAPKKYDWKGFLEVINDNIGESLLSDSDFIETITPIMNAAKGVNKQVYADMITLEQNWY